MPRLDGFVDQLVQGLPFALVVQIPQQPSLNEQFYEPMDIRVFVDERPVKPADLVILAVRVIVAALRSPDFIAHEDHRHA